MADLRSRARIPYGYSIVDGKAQINHDEAAALKLFFHRYLDGESMTAAAKEAHLPCSQTTLRHLITKKEYTGTDFYPPIITEEYQKKLIDEWRGRGGKVVGSRPTHPNKGVKIYKEFRLVKGRTYDEGDPSDAAAALYQRIKPRIKHTEPAPDGR